MELENTSRVKRGILTSAYKREIESEIRYAHAETISNMKLKITSGLISTPGTVLQISFFAIVLILMTM